MSTGKETYEIQNLANEIKNIETELPDIKIKKIISQSPIAVAYKIHHKKYGPALLKCFKGILLHNERFIKRVMLETKELQYIIHPYFTRIFQADYQPFPYIIREWIEGIDLDTQLSNKNFNSLEATELLIKITSALQATFNYRIRHKDIKAKNVFLCENDIIKLADFLLPPSVPYYMTPEQFLDIKADIRSDIYSLGILYYQVLTGNVPFRGHRNDIIKQHKQKPYPRIPGIPEEIENVLSKCLAKQPQARYTNPMELIIDLRQVKSRLQNDSRLQDPVTHEIPVFKIPASQLSNTDILFSSHSEPTRMLLIQKDDLKNARLSVLSDDTENDSDVAQEFMNESQNNVIDEEGEEQNNIIGEENELDSIQFSDDYCELEPDIEHLPDELPENLKRKLLLATDARTLSKNGTELSSLNISFPIIYKDLVIEYLKTVLRRECWVWQDSEQSDYADLVIDLELSKTFRYFNYFEDKIQNALSQLPVRHSFMSKSIVTQVESNELDINSFSQQQTISRDEELYTVLDTLISLGNNISNKNEEDGVINLPQDAEVDLPQNEEDTQDPILVDDNQDFINSKQATLTSDSQIIKQESTPKISNNTPKNLDNIPKTLELSVNFQNPCQTRAWYKLVKEHGWIQSKHFELAKTKTHSLKNRTFIVNLLELQEYEQKRVGLSSIQEFFQGDYDISRFDHGGMASVLKLSTKDNTILFLRPENYWARKHFEPYLHVKTGIDGKECVYATVPKGTEFVLKVAFRGKEEALIYESRLLSELAQHPSISQNIIGMVQQGSFLSTNDNYTTEKFGYYLMLEYAAGGNIEQFSHKFPDSRLPCNIATSILYSMILTLQTLKEKGIIHRDIKPQNILMDANGVPKLSDFGLAITVEKANSNLNEERRRLLRLVDKNFLTISKKKNQTQQKIDKCHDKLKHLTWSLTTIDDFLKKFENFSSQLNILNDELNDLDIQEKKCAEGLQQKYRPMSAEEIALKGEFAGSIYYAAPEQFAPTKILTCQCDVYQMGAVMYSMLTGRPPIKGKNIAEVMGKIVLGNRPRIEDILKRTPLHHAIGEIVYQMMDQDPEFRLTVEQVKSKLEDIIVDNIEELLQEPSFIAPKFKTPHDARKWQEKVDYAKKVYNKMLPPFKEIALDLQKKRKSAQENQYIVIPLWRDSGNKSFKFRCPTCKKHIQMLSSQVGKLIRCPMCKQKLIGQYLN